MVTSGSATRRLASWRMGASKLLVRRHDVQVGLAGSGVLEGKVAHVRAFGPIQRAEVALGKGHHDRDRRAPGIGNSAPATLSD
jgi:hypothetical protein